jgi:hypothetical protein
MNQYGMKQGLKNHGQKGINTIITELKQLEDRRELEPVLVSSLSRKERGMTLNHLMFLTENHRGCIKRGGFADSRKERTIISK